MSRCSLARRATFGSSPSWSYGRPWSARAQWPRSQTHSRWSRDADKKVVDVELDAEDGYLVWEVEVAVRDQGGVTKVIVDAGSGKVLASEVEKEDENKEKKEEGKDKKSK